MLQAKAGLEQGGHDLEQAELNLRYCDVVSEIDGVVTGRNVNPGNNVQAGQALMGYYKEPPTGPHAGKVLQPGER